MLEEKIETTLTPGLSLVERVLAEETWRRRTGLGNGTVSTRGVVEPSLLGHTCEGWVCPHAHASLGVSVTETFYPSVTSVWGLVHSYGSETSCSLPSGQSTPRPCSLRPNTETVDSVYTG